MKAKRNRDFSLRRPTHSQERMRKKKSVCSVRSRKTIRDASDANDGVGGGHISKLAATRRAGRRGRAHRETKVHFAAGPGVGQDPPLGSKRARRRGRSGAALLQDQSGPDQVGANASANEGRGKGK